MRKTLHGLYPHPIQNKNKNEQYRFGYDFAKELIMRYASSQLKNFVIPGVVRVHLIKNKYVKYKPDSVRKFAEKKLAFYDLFTTYRMRYEGSKEWIVKFHIAPEHRVLVNTNPELLEACTKLEEFMKSKLEQEQQND